MSIVPDGTQMGNETSNLVATFNKIYGAGNWQTAIYDAAAMWESYANINFNVVSDNGAAIGSGSYQQGNTNFGDIRIGGFAQAANVMAFTFAPPPANGDSSSGDIFINTNLQWGGQYGYDLETVMVHEIGHALGLAHSTDTNAAMYANYTGVKQVPDQDDVNGVDSIWGARAEDAIAQKSPNHSLSTAANIDSYLNTYSDQIKIPSLSTANIGEAYWFRVDTPANASSNFNVIVQSQYLSLLSPQVGVFSASGTLLGQTVASATSYGTYASVTLSNATPNTTYYIRVLGSNSGPNAVGAYDLYVNMGTYGLAPMSPPSDVVATQPSKGGGSMNETGGTTTSSGKQDPLYDFTKVHDVKAVGDDLTIAPAVLRHHAKLAAQIARNHPTLRAWSKHVVPVKEKTARTI